MAMPTPDPAHAAPWRAIAFALAGVSAFLSGLLMLIVSAEPPSDAPDAGEKDAAPEDGSASAAEGKRGQIEGVVALSGTPPVMRVAPERKNAKFCKSRPVAANAVLVFDGRLKDVLVRLENGGVKGDWAPPDEHAALMFSDCMYAPRMQGAMIGQELEIQNRDPTLHKVHAYRQDETWLDRAAPPSQGAGAAVLDLPGIFKFTCDVHPWERAFLVVTDHPFFAVSGADGRFVIPDVPEGGYMLEAWHARYGLRRVPVEVGDTPAVIKLTYETTDPEPEINRGEQRNLL
jgi:hypothetical protein